ncbi:MAG: hypothetical protein VXX63_00410 [Bacteroidota bacterium]|nr:hypothetical protein [Bacteroidota bacterium]
MDTFNKRLREKNKASKKKLKEEKKEERKKSSGGLEIDWSSAPENLTMSQEELSARDNLKSQS